MTLKEMAEWARMRACGPCRKSESYEHPACFEAKQIHDHLQTAIRIEQVDVGGKLLAGWLIPD
ncbi:MAG: hypothetical protein HY913_06620 [Desulfomonile tiedjei]|nr:hypothetical protein [Desulfomonile tiedjei]